MIIDFTNKNGAKKNKKILNNKHFNKIFYKSVIIARLPSGVREQIRRNRAEALCFLRRAKQTTDRRRRNPDNTQCAYCSICRIS